MEKDSLLMNGSGNNQTAISYRPTTMDIQRGSIASSSPLPHSYLNINWEIPFDQTHSIISSSASAGVSPAATELIGRSTSICNAGEIFPQSQAIRNHVPVNASCFNSPLNSPANLNLGIRHDRVNGEVPISWNSMNGYHGLTHFSALTPAFVDKAANYACFGERVLSGFVFQESEMHCSGKLARASSSKSLQAGPNRDVLVSANLPDTGMRPDPGCAAPNWGPDRQFNRLSTASTPESDEEEFSGGCDESTASDQVAIREPGSKNQNETGSRKRKAVQKGKIDTLASAICREAKIVETDESNFKRGRGTEAGCNAKDESRAKVEEVGGSIGREGKQQQTEDSQKPPEPPKKDYIHVRARRGQATDNHSLAERLRREKISERMKFLQDLVPVCNKVIGKAVMLDEIINYVQSLQRQVEFLSMKLATLNPRLNFNVDGFFPKDMLPSHGSSQITSLLDTSGSTFPCGSHPQLGPLQGSIAAASETLCFVNPLDSTLPRSLGMQLPLNDGIGDASSQLTTIWDDELQSVVQMAFGQNQDTACQWLIALKSHEN